MQETDVMLPIHSPLFAATTDQLIGSVPAAANPTITNWYYAHALELTVAGKEIGIRNSGWRANPYLITVEPEPCGDPADTVLYLLRSGFYVAFCGLSAGDDPPAGLICGASRGCFQVLFSAPDGTVRMAWIGLRQLTGSHLRQLRGIRARNTIVPFDPSAVSASLLRSLSAPEWTLVGACLPSLSARARRTLLELRRAMAGAFRSLVGFRTDRDRTVIRSGIPETDPASARADRAG